MDFQDLLRSALAEKEEEAALDELAEEVALFDLQEEDCPGSADEDANEEEEAQVEIALGPPGIPFFKCDMHSLYTQVTLVWPAPSDIDDKFLSIIDPSVVKECILKGFFLRQVNSSSVLIKYLLHTICCTTNEMLRYASYNSLVYAITTCISMPYIKDELCLALINLGADLSILQRDVLSYKSLVIPPPSCSAMETGNISEAKLREMLPTLLRFLSQCLKSHKTFTSEDINELLLIFVAMSLDPKVIDSALDTHIATCITHTLNLYSTDDFSENIKDIVKRIHEYCSGDMTSVVYLCQASFIPISRGKVLCSALAFHQLKGQLNFHDEDFISDVKVKDIADLLGRYLEMVEGRMKSYDAYYIITLIDLCICAESIKPGEEKYLNVICNLIEKEKRLSKARLNPDDMNPTISFQCLTATLSKWKRYLPEKKKVY